MNNTSMPLGQKATIRYGDGKVKDPKKRKYLSWLPEEKEILVKFYDLYHRNIEGLIQDYLPDREKKQIYQKVNTMKRTGEWGRILSGQDGRVLKKTKKSETLVIRQNMCESCQNVEFCKYISEIPLLGDDADKNIKYGVVACNFYRKILLR